MKKRKQLLLVALLGCCLSARAQWEWKDSNNVRHLSDQPPPASVPPSRILKAPRGQVPDLRKELAETPAALPGPAPLAKAPPSAAARSGEAAQRHEETVEAGRKAALAARDQAANAAACDSAQANLRVLQSGMRIATTDRDGTPAFLDDAQKAAQIQRNRDTLATHCQQ